MSNLARTIVRRGVLLLVTLGLIMGGPHIIVDGASPAAATPATPVLRTIAASLDALVASDPLQHLDPHNPYGALAYQLETLARGAQLFGASDPARSRRYVNLALRLADYLVAHDARSPDHHLGWGLAYSWAALGSNSPNPAYQVYAYQTSLVAWALLDIYTISDRPIYLETVERVMDGYLSVGTTHLGAGCANCFMFWYSTNHHEVGRYVKNTNVLMGMVVAQLWQLTSKAQYAQIARWVYNEETWEVTQRGDYGYFGVDDPRFSRAAAPEAHITLETFAYSQLTSLLGLLTGDSRATLNRLDAIFWNCGQTCLSAPVALGLVGPPTTYLQFMTCYPATFNPVYAANCAKLVAGPKLLLLAPFPLSGLLYAQPILPAS